MCEIKTVTIVAVLLLAATGSCRYQKNSEKKVRHHSEIKTKSLCGKQHKKTCLNGGECYYLVGEDIVGGKCTWLYGGQGCEEYMWWT